MALDTAQLVYHESDALAFHATTLRTISGLYRTSRSRPLPFQDHADVRSLAPTSPALRMTRHWIRRSWFTTKVMRLRFMEPLYALSLVLAHESIPSTTVSGSR